MPCTITAFARKVIAVSPTQGDAWKLGIVLQAAPKAVPVIPLTPAKGRRGNPTEVFVHPMSVAEFAAYDPNYLEKWLIKYKCDPAMVADFSQDLFLFLCKPTKLCIELGLPDKMGLYNPALIGNPTSVEAWANWLTRNLLMHEYWKLLGRDKRSHTTGTDVISLSEDEADAKSGCPTWWKLMDQDERKQMEAGAGEVYSQVTSSMLVHELLNTLEEEVGLEARQVLELVAQTETITQAAEILGMRPRRVHQTMRDARMVLSSVLGINARELLTHRLQIKEAKQA